jgi:hypothetical protein
MSGFAGRMQRFLSENVPWFLQDPNGGAFLEAIGLTLDVGTQTLLTGLRQMLPFQAFLDNLRHIGEDRGLVQQPTESEQSYRRRLAEWRQILAHHGSHYGEMIDLQPFFLPGSVPRIRIVHQAGDGSCATWHTLNPDGSYERHKQTPSNWNWDQNFFRWSRFWVIIYVDADVGPVGAEWDDGCEWDDGTIWDGYLNEDQIADILAIINGAKAPHSVCAGIIIATDPASFDPTAATTAIGDGTFTHPSGDWDRVIRTATGLPVRLATASYAYEDESALP